MPSVKLLLGLFALLSFVSAGAEDVAKPLKVKVREKVPAKATPAEGATEEIESVWQRIGPHAAKGTKLAKDNEMAFGAYYLSAAKQIADMKKGKEPKKQEVMALLFIPTPYGWPESRSLEKNSKYTGLVPIFRDGVYEVTMVAWPEAVNAKIVLEIDGVPIKAVASPNKAVRVPLQAGVRALTVRTEDEVKMSFQKLSVELVED